MDGVAVIFWRLMIIRKTNNSHVETTITQSHIIWETISSAIGSN